MGSSSETRPVDSLRAVNAKTRSFEKTVRTILLVAEATSDGNKVKLYENLVDQTAGAYEAVVSAHPIDSVFNVQFVVAVFRCIQKHGFSPTLWEELVRIVRRFDDGTLKVVLPRSLRGVAEDQNERRGTGSKIPGSKRPEVVIECRERQVAGSKDKGKQREVRRDLSKIFASTRLKDGGVSTENKKRKGREEPETTGRELREEGESVLQKEHNQRHAGKKRTRPTEGQEYQKVWEPPCARCARQHKSCMPGSRSACRHCRLSKVRCERHPRAAQVLIVSGREPSPVPSDARPVPIEQRASSSSDIIGPKRHREPQTDIAEAQNQPKRRPVYPEDNMRDPGTSLNSDNTIALRQEMRQMIQEMRREQTAFQQTVLQVMGNLSCELAKICGTLASNMSNMNPGRGRTFFTAQTPVPLQRRRDPGGSTTKSRTNERHDDSKGENYE